MNIVIFNLFDQIKNVAVSYIVVVVVLPRSEADEVVGSRPYSMYRSG